MSGMSANDTIVIIAAVVAAVGSIGATIVSVVTAIVGLNTRAQVGVVADHVNGHLSKMTDMLKDQTQVTANAAALAARSVLDTAAKAQETATVTVAVRPVVEGEAKP